MADPRHLQTDKDIGSVQPHPRRAPHLHPAAPPQRPDAGSPGPLSVPDLQRLAGNRAVAQLLAPAQTETSLQRQEPTPAPAPNSSPSPTAVIIEDDVADPRPEQLRRSDFVTQARTAATQGVAAGAGPLAGRGDPELRTTFSRYQGQSAAGLEATVRGEVEGAAAATTAAAMIGAIRDSSTIEARARIASGVSDEVAASAKDALENGTRAIGSLGGLLFKGQPDQRPTATADDVGEARARLGAGEPPPPGLRSEVEQATGADLSTARVHRSAPAAATADRMDARAFTVGTDIVLGAAEEPTGSVVGDALLAHELGHAAQQSGATTQPARAAENSAGEHDPAEHAADDVAVTAVLATRLGLRDALSSVGAEASRRIKSGLRLQSCGRSKIDPSKEDLNKKVLERMDNANADHGAKGIHYPFEFEAHYPDEWRRLGQPAEGHADSRYWERVGFMHWVRKSGVSASDAMDAFFAGPTIADCASVIVASQIAALRAALGDSRFDKAFGGSGSKPREKDGKRVSLEISQSVNASILDGLMRPTPSATDAGSPGHRNVSPGEHHYFKNHPAYAIRHPTGYWQGENAVYTGEVNGVQMFSGFGAPGKSEAKMNATLVDEYNYPPNGEDLAKRQRLYAKNGPDVAAWPKDEQKYHGVAPDSITVESLLAAGGGLQTAAGQELDPAKVEALKKDLD